MDQRVSLVTLGVAFVDPDGHPWEVAVNPNWTIGADGSVRLG